MVSRQVARAVPSLGARGGASASRVLKRSIACTGVGWMPVANGTVDRHRSPSTTSDRVRSSACARELAHALYGRTGRGGDRRGEFDPRPTARVLVGVLEETGAQRRLAAVLSPRAWRSISGSAPWKACISAFSLAEPSSEQPRDGRTRSVYDCHGGQARDKALCPPSPAREPTPGRADQAAGSSDRSRPPRSGAASQRLAASSAPTSL